MELAKRSSTYLLITGLLGMVFGVVMMAKPGATAVALVIVWGIYALLDGLFSFFSAFQEGASGGLRAFLILLGVVGVLAGLIAIFRPISSGIALAIVLGFWLIVRGVAELAAAFGGSADSRWMALLAGALWILAGVLVLANPGVGLLSVAVWVGVLSVVWGAISFWLGWRVRGEVKSASA